MLSIARPCSDLVPRASATIAPSGARGIAGYRAARPASGSRGAKPLDCGAIASKGADSTGMMSADGRRRARGRLRERAVSVSVSVSWLFGRKATGLRVGRGRQRVPGGRGARPQMPALAEGQV